MLTERQVRVVAVAALALAVAGALRCGCRRDDAGTARRAERRIVVTTSMIECAVRDVGGDDFQIVRLVPPQACPGHFDLTPRDLESISSARLFIRHDYQAFLDKKLTGSGKNAARTCAIASEGPQTIPGNYLSLCEQVSRSLSELWPEEAGRLAAGLAETKRLVGKSGESVHSELASKLKGKAVLVSDLQKEFCEWAGLSVCGTFDSGDTASMRDVETAVRTARGSGASAVVCNLQRGTREGKVLAERLGLPLIALSNFPVGGEKGAYIGLLEGNAHKLLKALDHE